MSFDNSAAQNLRFTNSELLKLNTSSANATASLKSMTDLLKRLADVLAPVKKKMEGLKSAMDVFKNLKPIVKKGSTSKFAKGMKRMGSFVKDIMMGGAKTWALEKLMLLLQPFIDLLDLFNPIFEVMGAIIQEALLPVIMELNPIIMQMVQWLMENKEAIIQVINVLVPLLLIFHLLRGDFEELQVIMIPLTAIVEKLTTDWNNLITVITILSDYITTTFSNGWNWLLNSVLTPIYDFIVGEISNAFDTLKDWFEALEGWMGDFVGWIDNLGDAFDDLEDWFDDAIGWIEDLIETANSFNPVNWGGGGGGGGGGGDDDDDFDIWDPGTWFGPDMYSFDSPKTIGVGNEGQTEYLMREDKLLGLLKAAGGSDTEEMVYEQQKTRQVLEEIRDNTQNSGGVNRRLFG